MDGLVALGIGFIYSLAYFWILNDSIIDIQKQSFALNRIQFCYYALYLNLL